MPAFAGDYVREPSDFATVATEADLLQLLDDPSDPLVPDDVLTWSDLDSGQQEALAGVANPVIARKEGVINGYLRAGGYAVPADIVRNPLIQDYAVRLTWNDLRYRKGQLTDEQYKAANADILRELLAISKGDMLLDAAPSTEETASSGAVYAAASAERVFSRAKLEDF